MHRKSVIVLEYETREKLKEIGKKSETYDQIVQGLIQLREHKA